MLLISFDESLKNGYSLLNHAKELTKVLAQVPGESLTGPEASKEEVLEQITRGRASMILFLCHGDQGGRC